VASASDSVKTGVAAGSQPCLVDACLKPRQPARVVKESTGEGAAGRQTLYMTAQLQTLLANGGGKGLPPFASGR
jgi:hypothetical protein